MPGDWFQVQVTTYKVGWEARYNIRAEKLRDGSNEVDEKAGSYECLEAHNFGAAMLLLNQWILERVSPEGR